MRIETGDGWELRLGDCLDPEIGLPSLADDSVRAFVCDPPYSARTHAGQRYEHKMGDGHELATNGLSYAHLTDAQVGPLCSQFHRVSTAWCCVMTDHVLFPTWEREMLTQGRYAFAPLPIVTPGANVRLAGDGPSNWTVYMSVSRPRGHKDGTKPGYYKPRENTRTGRDCPVKGTKPLSLMEAILGDYTNPGDIVCDPFAGSGTTAVACIRTGRQFIGYEREAKHFEYAVARLRGRLGIDPRQEGLF